MKKYEAPIANVVDFENEYVMALVSPIVSGVTPGGSIAS